MAFCGRLAPLRVISALCVHNQQAWVCATGFSALIGAESLVGFMTADFGENDTDGRKRSPSQLALLRDIELRLVELKAVEKRLGSPEELPGDMEEAREIAHRVNNLLTTYRLGGDLIDGGFNI
jgi:hypothetical protein